MKVDNRFVDFDNRSCGQRGIALSARPVGDVLQGAAADCNSAEATRAWFDSRVAHHLPPTSGCKMTRPTRGMRPVSVVFRGRHLLPGGAETG